jgi:hypothetical protein
MAWWEQGKPHSASGQLPTGRVSEVNSGAFSGIGSVDYAVWSEFVGLPEMSLSVGEGNKFS